MTNLAVQVSDLSKLYRIAAGQHRSDTLRDSIVNVLSKGRRNGNAHDLVQGNTSSATTDLWALKDVSFTVNQGEVVGVIGRNGAGKSTLLKILSRITEPTLGRVELHGRVASLLEVGTGFHPELTGRENIYLNGAILGMHRWEIDRKFDEIVAFAEIARFLDTPVKRYSSGMYVRLAFAVAAHLEPEILLVDEVLAVGDAAFQKKCMGKMGDVARAGRTVLFVSHNMVAVQTLCQRAILLDAGHIRTEGAVGPVVSTYLRSGISEQVGNERVWPNLESAPGNATVRLRRIAVIAETAGTANDVISMDTPVRIEVDYYNLLPEAHLHTTLHICTDQGIVAFSASSGFEPDPVLHLRPARGLYHSVCHIPGSLLNSGVHYINLLMVRDTDSSVFQLDNAIQFEVISNTERKYAWYGREPGAVQPRLVWETLHQSDA